MFSQPSPNILVVDPELSALDFAKRALTSLSDRITAVSDLPEAWNAIKAGDFDVVLFNTELFRNKDLELFPLTTAVKRKPNIILVGNRDAWSKSAVALSMHASQLLFKPFSTDELLQVVQFSCQNALKKRAAGDYCRSLEESVLRRTKNLEAALRDVASNIQSTLEALVVALDAREHETYAHSFRVRAYTTHLASLIGYTPALLAQLEHAALLHDIGKIAISDAILLKPDALTDEEWADMKKHPVAGEQMLRRVAFLKPAAPIVRHHHERYDGAGYPDSLYGEQIPLGARLFAFADTLDAITSHRPYRQARGYQVVQEEIRRCMGTQFDPHIAKIFLQVPEETWRTIRTTVERQYCQPAICVSAYTLGAIV